MLGHSIDIQTAKGNKSEIFQMRECAHNFAPFSFERVSNRALFIFILSWE